MKTLKLSLFFLLSLCSSLAFADDQTSQATHQGSYVEVNAGVPLIYILFSSLTSPTSGYAWSIAYGYQFRPRGVAVEAGWIQANPKEIYTSDQTSDVTTTATDHFNMPYLALRWEVPMSQRVSFVPKVGVMYIMPTKHISAVENGQYYTFTTDFNRVIAPYASLGFSYAVTSKVNLNVQYQGVILGIISEGVVTAGINYHF